MERGTAMISPQEACQRKTALCGVFCCLRDGQRRQCGVGRGVQTKADRGRGVSLSSDALVRRPSYRGSGCGWDGICKPHRDARTLGKRRYPIDTAITSTELLCHGSGTNIFSPSHVLLFVQRDQMQNSTPRRPVDLHGLCCSDRIVL